MQYTTEHGMTEEIGALLLIENLLTQKKENLIAKPLSIIPLRIPPQKNTHNIYFIVIITNFKRILHMHTIGFRISEDNISKTTSTRFCKILISKKAI